MSLSTRSRLRAGARFISSVALAFFTGALVLGAIGARADDEGQRSFRVNATNLVSSGTNSTFLPVPGYHLRSTHGDETLIVSVLDGTSALERGNGRTTYAPGVDLVQDDAFLLAEVEAPQTPVAAPGGGFDLTSVPLPGAPADGLFLDYLAVDHARHRVWVPAGGTGSADVIDAQTLDLTRVENFPTAEIERNGTKRKVGPSSATVGDGVVYVGNRGDSSVCAVDATTLVKGACVTLPSMPDGVAYVASSKEVWVTTPRDQSIEILDVSNPSAPKTAGRIALEGDPEGYAVDDARGFFYTNLEDKDRTLQIDIATRAVTATWMPECGEAGPRCLVIDPSGELLVVACTDHVEVLDVGRDGAILSKLETGDGVDSFDYLPARRSLYVAASRAATLTIAHLDESGRLESTAVIPTSLGARNAVVTADGVAFIAVGPEGKILVVHPAD
jgi:outer membrane protein assembly factor BamB